MLGYYGSARLSLSGIDPTPQYLEKIVDKDGKQVFSNVQVNGGYDMYCESKKDVKVKERPKECQVQYEVRAIPNVSLPIIDIDEALKYANDAYTDEYKNDFSKLRENFEQVVKYVPTEYDFKELFDWEGIDPVKILNIGPSLVAFNRARADTHLFPRNMSLMILSLLTVITDRTGHFKVATSPECLRHVEYMISLAALLYLAPCMCDGTMKTSDIRVALYEVSEGRSVGYQKFLALKQCSRRRDYADRKVCVVPAEKFRDHNKHNREKLLYTAVKAYLHHMKLLDDSSAGGKELILKRAVEKARRSDESRIVVEKVEMSYAEMPYIESDVGVIYGDNAMFGGLWRVGVILNGVISPFTQISEEYNNLQQKICVEIAKRGPAYAKVISGDMKMIFDIMECRAGIRQGYRIHKMSNVDGTQYYKRVDMEKMVMNINGPLVEHVRVSLKIDKDKTRKEVLDSAVKIMYDKHISVYGNLVPVNLVAKIHQSNMYYGRCPIILAPSWTGKTYYAERNPDRVIDGDKLYDYPPGEWWKKAERRREVHKERAEILRVAISKEYEQAFAGGLKPRVVLMETAGFLTTQSLQGFRAIFVVPSDETYKIRFANPEGRSKNQSSAEDAVRAIRDVRNFLEENRIRAVPSFDVALDILFEHEYDLGGNVLAARAFSPRIRS
jgi:hypothetical protein